MEKSISEQIARDMALGTFPKKSAETLREETQNPTDIVGHKTFDAGEINPETGFPILTHEPLTRAEADALLEASDQAQKLREEIMPNEQAAIKMMMEAWLRLKELGWREAMYCPKDGTPFKAIEAGSTGIHRCHYEGQWASGHFWIADAGDMWPAHPILFHLYPEDQAKYDERMAAARERFQRENT